MRHGPFYCPLEAALSLIGGKYKPLILWLDRTVIPEKPPRTRYALTSFGRSIIPVLDAMCEWGKTHLEEQGGEGVFYSSEKV